MSPTEIKVNPNKKWRALLLAAVASAALYLYLGYLPFIVWVVAIIAGVALLFNLVTGQNKGTVILLDDEGIFDRRLKVGVIRWEDIRRVVPHEVEGGEYISLELHDAKAYEARRPLWLKLLSQVQRVHGMGSISISVSGLDIDSRTLFDKIHEGCHEARLRNVETA
jgi:hypothetical protein